MSVLIAGGTGAVNGVLLASAVVPPVIVLVVCRIAWIWAKTSDETARTSIGGILRRAFWLEEKKPSGT
jgi:hypothetical protein